MKAPKLLLNSILCFALTASLLGCGRKPPKEQISKIPVRAIQVKKGALKETFFYVGDIKAENEAQVFPKVTGKIIEKLVKEGSSVKKDDVLAYIDRDEVGFQFEKAPVESPIGGILGRLYVDIGTSVSPQAPIGLVVNMDTVEVKVDVVERDLPKLKVGQEAQVKVDAYPDEVFEGVVEEVSPVVDLASRTALIKITIPNNDHRLKPGMFARINILIDEKKDVLVIARDALIRENSSYYVFVVEDNKAHKRKVEIGLQENNKFEVLNGLAEAELVITMGNTRLKEGDLVEVIAD